MLTLAGAICHTEPAWFLAIHLNVPACVIRAFSITSLDRPARLSGLQSKRACEQHSHNAILIDREYSVKTHELLLPEFKNSKTMHCAGYPLTLPLAHQTYFAVHVCALVCLKNNCDEKPWSIIKKVSSVWLIDIPQCNSLSWTPLSQSRTAPAQVKTQVTEQTS